jgi:hypothetical protein
MTHIILIDWHGPLELVKAGTLLREVKRSPPSQYNFQYRSESYKDTVTLRIPSEYTAPISSLLKELL